MTHDPRKPLALAALGAALLGAASPALAMTELAQGYALAAQAQPPASSTASDKTTAEATPAATDAQHASSKPVAKSGHQQPKAPAKPAADPHAKQMAEGKCGEGGCGGGA